MNNGVVNIIKALKAQEAVVKGPRYLIIDIREVMVEYTKAQQLFNIYKYFPLRDILECILTTAAYQDNGEYLWMELERRFGDVKENFDYDFIDLMFDILTQYLDQLIRSRTPEVIDTNSYVFQKWLGSTSVILEKDENAASIYSTCPPSPF